jgi:hypothetical protein
MIPLALGGLGVDGARLDAAAVEGVIEVRVCLNACPCLHTRPHYALGCKCKRMDMYVVP